MYKCESCSLGKLLFPTCERLLQSTRLPGRFDWQKLDIYLGSDIFLIELRAYHCCLDVVFDLGFTRKPSERWWESLLDMLHVHIWVESDPHTSDFEVPHYVIALAVAVEREFEAERVIILAS